jgi:hypothetical protein
METSAADTINMRERPDPFDPKLSVNRFHWSHLGYHIRRVIYDFFSEPEYKRELSRELDLLDNVRTLVDGKFIEKRENVDFVRELIRLHRILENTRARRRLEKWSLRVISWYLLCVLCIIFLTYGDCSWELIKPLKLVIEDNVMIAILTTTTANIIGLGLIVLRGHFHLMGDISEKAADSASEKERRNIVISYKEPFIGKRLFDWK